MLDPSTYRCRGCGAEFLRDWYYPVWQPMAEHVVACDSVDEKYRALAAQWLRTNLLAPPVDRQP